MNKKENDNSAGTSQELDAVAVSVTIAGKECDVSELDLFQSISNHHRFTIKVNYRSDKPSVWAAGPDQLFKSLGEKVAIQMQHQQSGESTEFYGLITDMDVTGEDGDQGYVTLYGGSPTLLLDRDPSMGCFTDYNLASIVSETLEKSGVEIHLENKPRHDKIIPYVARYKESSYAFLSRVLRSYGEWFYYDGDRLIVGDPSIDKETRAEYDLELQSLKIASGIRNLNTSVFDYNAAENLFLEETPPDQIEGINLYTRAAAEKSAPFYPNATRIPATRPIFNDKEAIDYVRHSHCREYSGMSVFTATTRTCSIRLGELVVASIPPTFKGVELTDLGRYRVVEITHHFDCEGHYSNTFKGLVGLTETMPLGPEPLPMAFPEIATVTDTEDPLKLGRVKVKFLWQNPQDKDDCSGWMRVQTPSAGTSEQVSKNRGMVFIPEVDDQVMVGFEQGCPDRPFVMGSLFHKDNTAGAAENNTLKTITTRSGHTIEFNDDSEGDWGITIKDAAGNILRLNTKEKNIEITAPETISITAKNIQMTAEEKINLSAKQNIEQQTEAEFTCQAKGNINIQSEKDIAILGKGQIDLTATKDMALSGENLSAQGKIKAEIGGTETAIKGNAQTTLQGASGKIEIL